MKFQLLFSSLLAIFILATSAKAQDHEYNLDETYSIGDGETIRLQSDDADVTIRGTNRENVHIRIHRNVTFGNKPEDYTFTFNIEHQNGVLFVNEIEEVNNGGWFSSYSIDRETYNITIEAPHSVSLDIEGDDDTYTINAINGSIKLDADDVSADLRENGGSQFEFTVDDGSIHMDRGKGTLQLDMDDGEFSVDEGEFTEIIGHADDGNFSITTSLADNGRYQFQMDDGQLDFMITAGGGTFNLQHDDANVHTQAPFEEVEVDEKHSEYRLSGGSAMVNIQADDAMIQLRHR